MKKTGTWIFYDNERESNMTGRPTLMINRLSEPALCYRNLFETIAENNGAGMKSFCTSKMQFLFSFQFLRIKQTGTNT